MKVCLADRPYDRLPDPQAGDNTVSKSPETIIDDFNEWNDTRPRKPPRELSKSTEEAIRKLQETSEGREKIRDYRNPAYVVTKALELHKKSLDPSELWLISCVNTIIGEIKQIDNPGFDL